MQSSPRIVAFVPARAGSSRLKDKNLRRIGGVPLALRKINQLKKVPLVNEVFLDTNSEELIRLASNSDVPVLRRPAELASNSVDGHELFQWEADKAPDADIVVQALPTAPFLQPETMQAALAALVESEHDSVLTISMAKNYHWVDGVPSYGTGRIPNSQDMQPLVIETMGFYAVKKTSSEFPRRRFGSNPLLFEVNRLEAIDIDDTEDFELALSIERGRNLTEAQEFNLLKHYLSSSLLADVGKARGIAVLANRRIKLQTVGKILGRARTISLSALGNSAEEEEWREIYRGLDLYKAVNFGDILCVGSDIPERAYFGEINAHLAIRAGAGGAVLDCVTRDIEAVERLGFPVFARGNFAGDILFEGKVSSLGRAVTVGGVLVNDGDIVFGDGEGVVVIEAKDWPVLSSAALSALAREEGIRRAILDGTDEQELLDEFGDF